MAADRAGVAEGGQVSLRGLPPLVVVQVLFGIWQRTRGGAKITDIDLRGACRALRRQQVVSIEAVRHRAMSPASRSGRC